jgi:hypothetical protein
MLLHAKPDYIKRCVPFVRELWPEGDDANGVPTRGHALADVEHKALGAADAQRVEHV